MNNQRPRFLTLLLVAASLTMASCVDEFLTEDPPHILVADNLYNSVEGFEQGVNALYVQVRRERWGQSGVNQLMNMMWSIGVDNAYGNYPASVERIFNDWGARNDPQESLYRETWEWLYQTINAANTIIVRADNPDVDWNPEGLSEEAVAARRNRILAEARLIRAWAYRHLTYMWGNVPLNLDESTGETIRTDWTRTPVAEVRAQMEADLLFAEEHLPEAPANSNKLSKAVARHYLAELYLTMDRPADAEAKARLVTDSGAYHLITERYGVQAGAPGVPFMDMFIDGNVHRTQGNTEALWTLEYEPAVVGGGESIMRRYWVNRYYSLRGVQVSAEYGGRGIGRFAPTGWALENYEPQDDRASEYAIRWFYRYNDPNSLPSSAELGDTLWLPYELEGESLSNPAWPSTRKWDWASPNDVEGAGQYGDQVYLRLAETYLLLAEAHLMQDELPEAAASINKVRERAGATPIDPEEVTLDFILDERSRELLTEEHRRHTLVRTGRWLERTRAYNGIVDDAIIRERDALFPIPQVVIDANLTSDMAQNPGYN